MSEMPVEKVKEQAALSTHTFQERAKEATYSLVYLGALAGALGFGYLTFTYLKPTKLGPNSVYDAAFEKIRNHSEVTARLGSPVKAYGRDMGGRNQGRRNFVDYDEYADDDGKMHTRVKFNLEGPNGKAVCYAEKSVEDVGPEDFSYIILEHQMRGRKDAIALVDNRKTLTPEEIQDKVTKKLAASKIQLFGTTTCQWTKKQLDELGEFSERINVLYCDKIENKEICEKAQLPGYPTWRYQEQNVPGGFKTMDQLQQIARML